MLHLGTRIGRAVATVVQLGTRNGPIYEPQVSRYGDQAQLLFLVTDLADAPE